MKTFTLLFIVLSILAVCSAAGKNEGRKKKSAAGKSPEVDSQNAEIADDPSVAEENKISQEENSGEKKTRLKKKPTERNMSRQKSSGKANNILGILNNPVPKILKMEVDPATLGKQIGSMAEKEREEIIDILKDLINGNKGTLPEKFYRATLAAVQKPKAAAKWWENELKKEISKFSGLQTPFIDFRRIAEADPLGTGLEGTNALLQNGVASGLEGAAKVSDKVHDDLETIQALVERLGKPLESVPFVAPIKRNADKLWKSNLAQSKYLWGRNFDEAAKTWSTLANDSSQNYKSKYSKLRGALRSDDDEEEEEEEDD